MLQSRPYLPQPGQCCEKCVFGRGAHSEFCEVGKAWHDTLAREFRKLWDATHRKLTGKS